MKTKKQHIDYWVDQSGDDWETAQILFKNKKYLHALFWSHLVLEKLCKALWIAHNTENTPPRTHNLIYLLSKTNLNTTEE
jgi:AbiV family abortive infection protein